jgi:hypothetical protein
VIVITARPLTNEPAKLWTANMVLNQWGCRDINQSKVASENVTMNAAMKHADSAALLRLAASPPVASWCREVRIMAT